MHYYTAYEMHSTESGDRLVRGRRPRRTVPALLCISGVMLVAPAVASGHAAFLEAAPAPGESLRASPAELTLQFTEPLDRSLTSAVLLDLATGRGLPVAVAEGAERELIVRPRTELQRGVYQVKWHTVSTLDGHALEGTLAFGVKRDIAGVHSSLEQSPLARGGLLRMGLRGLFYAALLFFAAGIGMAVLRSPRGEATAWLVPSGIRGAMGEAGRDPGRLARRAWRLTINAGWIAVTAAVGVAIGEAIDASGGLRPEGLTAFLVSNVAGAGRVLVVGAVLAAVVLAPRRRLGSAFALAVAFLAIALSGHANSSEYRLVAVLTDWVHLLAGTIWVGGLAQIAATWLPGVRGASQSLRSLVMSSVLAPFGRIALPAFLVSVLTGLTSALVELGSAERLWQTPYGRVLLIKLGLVVAIALLSFWHSSRLRPRLISTSSPGDPRLDRRHWRLLGFEPFIGLLVVLAAGVLVTFPIPPSQVTETAAAEAPTVACDPCPQPTPRRDELAVAEQVGSNIVAAWISRVPGAYRGRLQVLGRKLVPVPERPTLRGGSLSACGPGCWRFEVDGRRPTLEVSVTEGGRRRRTTLPARWAPDGERQARDLLNRAQSTMGGLDSVRQRERVTSGPGSLAETVYRLVAPDRLSFTTAAGVRGITIGGRQWLLQPELGWRQEPYAGGGPPFRTRSFFRWTSYARSVRLLRVSGQSGNRTAEIALMDPGTPVWTRLTIDLATYRVLAARVIADAHFMDQRFSAFDAGLSVTRPTARGPQP